ncbi:hypothetical protein EI94DRAFT_677982 [Lactarius quietus]|nr:hypothetical protein EI94DRAFT_677982 [Lactarius quietus]
MYTTAIAYAAAVSCYIDIIFLLPICRNFVALLRYTSLNHVIPSEKDCTSHDARLVLFTGQGTWSILPNFRWPTLIPRPLAPTSWSFLLWRWSDFDFWYSPTSSSPAGSSTY